MTLWLDPLRAALDVAPAPVPFFFRDDDAGWGDDRLWPLLERLGAAGAPADLAVIPAALSPGLARRLLGGAGGGDGRIAVHQHGWAHLNHELEGRKCEFGPSRSPVDQRRDLARGRARMVEAFGEHASAAFVPPWNRCTEVTARLAADLGFRVLSRDTSAGMLGVTGLAEIPVTVDWSARVRRGEPIGLAERGARLAAATATAAPVGVMLHHEVMSDNDLEAVSELATLLTRHPAAVLRLMNDLVPAA